MVSKNIENKANPIWKQFHLWPPNNTFDTLQPRLQNFPVYYNSHCGIFALHPPVLVQKIAYILYAYPF